MGFLMVLTVLFDFFRNLPVCFTQMFNLLSDKNSKIKGVWLDK